MWLPFFRLSFEYEERSLNIAKIQSYMYFTGKNVPFLSHSDLDLRKLTYFCMKLYCAYTNMLFIQTDWITEELENVLEKISAYRWENTRGQQRL